MVESISDSGVSSASRSSKSSRSRGSCRSVPRPHRSTVALLLGELHEVAQHVLHRRDVDLPTDDAVLDEPVLELFFMSTQMSKNLVITSSTQAATHAPLRGEDVVQRHQRGILLADGDQLLGPFQGVRWV